VAVTSSEGIVRTPGTCGGKARIAAHRIRVLDVVAWHEHQGMSPDEIVAQIPSLSHLDENVAAALAVALRLRNIDVTTTNDARLAGASDRTQLSFARASGRVIVTQDDDFLRLHASGVDHARIVFA
jgi:uncharacterized protein (DUF433 family)